MPDSPLGLSVCWANGSMLSKEKPYEAAVPVVPLYPLLSALDSAYHPQMHYGGHPVDFLTERLGLSDNDRKAWREWEAKR